MSALAFPLAGPLGGDPVDVDVLNNISKLLTAICSAGVQPIEECLQQLLTQRALQTAIGAQLDAIGLIVGRPRAGLDDETYRRYCRAAISVHRSKGRISDVLGVANLAIFDEMARYVVEPRPVATALVRVEDIAVSDALAAVTFAFLSHTVAAGMRLMLDYGVAPPAEWFRFDIGPGFNDGHLLSRIDH